MSEIRKLSPVEQKRLNRSLNIVRDLSKRSNKTDMILYVIRERTRHSLRILGAKDPNRVMVAQAVSIVTDKWPFKIRRLRKLING